MYGLVNQAIKDLVVNKFSEDQWNRICQESKLDNTDFISLQYYPDTVTYSLVGSASKVLGLSAEDILYEFGQYWVLYTAKEGYGPLMDLFGSSFKDCLQNLNSLHARMGMTMPQLSPPKFTFNEIQQNHYQVEYHSVRQGLCPMVSGLLKGLATKHNTKVEISFDDLQGRKIFSIKVIE